MTIGLSINECLHSKKQVRRESTRLTSQKVWASATSKVWRDSGRASFYPPRFKKTKEAVLPRWMRYPRTFCSNTWQMKVNLENKIFSIKKDPYGWGINFSWFVCFPSQFMWRFQGLSRFCLFVLLRGWHSYEQSFSKSRATGLLCNLLYDHMWTLEKSTCWVCFFF